MPCMCGTFEFCDECITALEAPRPELTWDEYAEYVVLVIGPSLDPAIIEALDGIAEHNRRWMSDLLDTAEAEDDEPFYE